MKYEGVYVLGNEEITSLLKKFLLEEDEEECEEDDDDEEASSAFLSPWPTVKVTVEITGRKTVCHINALTHSLKGLNDKELRIWALKNAISNEEIYHNTLSESSNPPTNDEPQEFEWEKIKQLGFKDGKFFVEDDTKYLLRLKEKAPPNKACKNPIFVPIEDGVKVYCEGDKDYPVMVKNPFFVLGRDSMKVDYLEIELKLEYSIKIPNSFDVLREGYIKDIAGIKEFLKKYGLYE
jgi:hypothetical protein